MGQETRKRELKVYTDPNGKEPFLEWLYALKDKKTRNRILRRLDRVEDGNFGDHKGIGDGVSELRLFFGAGYRVYFAEDGDVLVILLCGGDKSSQDKDIVRAKAYWEDYQRRKI